MNCLQWLGLAMAAAICFHLLLDSWNKELANGNSPLRLRLCQWATVTAALVTAACVFGAVWVLYLEKTT